MDDTAQTGADFREVRDSTHEGEPVRVVVASRAYATDRDDLWNAMTDRERIPRWFLPITGDLELGGRYQLEGNAEGSILECTPPETLKITWEFAGNVSWVHIDLADLEGGTRLTLEHLMPKDDASEEHWKQYGPGATGVGWDLSFVGLARHLDQGSESFDETKWLESRSGKDFLRHVSKSWSEAHIKAGETQSVAVATAERTAAFYAGE